MIYVVVAEDYEFHCIWENEYFNDREEAQKVCDRMNENARSRIFDTTEFKIEDLTLFTKECIK